MDILFESLKAEWESMVRLSPRIFMAVLVMLVFIIGGRLLGKSIAHFMSRGKFSQTHRNFFRSLTAWFVSIIGLIIVLNILGLKSLATSLVAGGGITAVVLGFAFREIGENFLAGFFLAFSRPFDVGDMIQSDEFRGTVRSIDLRSTHIRTIDGKDTYIPSSQIFNKPLTNYTRDGLRRLSFTVGIDYSDDSEKARDLLTRATESVPGVLEDPPPLASMSALEPQFVKLEMAFWIDTFQKGTGLVGIRNRVIENCRRTLMDRGFTVSCNMTTNLALGSFEPVDVQLNRAS